jgi:YidC/Oxa1 family membrane protein insertase
VNHALYAATPAPDRLGVDYEFSDGRVTVRKTFRFTKTGYLTQVSTEVLNGGVPVPHYIAWRGGFGDPTAANATAQQQAVYYDVTGAKLVKNDVKSAKDGPVTASGTFTFAGLQDAYFAAVFLPGDANSIEVRTVSDTVPAPYSTEPQPHVGAEVGGAPVNRFAVFAGPKDLDLLRSVDPRLEQLVDFGKYFGVIAKPLFLAVNWFNDRFIHDYGWSIVVVTVIINLLMFPLRLSSMKSMRKMAALQPQIAAINEKYKGISLRDPKKAQQNQEMMDLYKKNGVNPIGGGCFPMLLQLPFFIAFYTVLTVAIEMRGAHWLWISDLSRHDPFYLLPLIMIVTQVVVQRMTPQTSMDPAQQKIMMFMMPLMMGFFFMQAAAGLVLYWVTGNLMSLAQQWFFNRITPAPAPAVVDVKPVGKKSRK